MPADEVSAFNRVCLELSNGWWRLDKKEMMSGSIISKRIFVGF